MLKNMCGFEKQKACLAVCRRAPFSTLLMCRHICISLCSLVRYMLRWSLISCVWSVITIFPSSWDWTARPPAGIDKAPSSASLLIPVVFFFSLFFFFFANDYFQRFVLLKKKKKTPSAAGDEVPHRRHNKDKKERLIDILKDLHSHFMWDLKWIGIHLSSKSLCKMANNRVWLFGHTLWNHHCILVHQLVQLTLSVMTIIF